MNKNITIILGIIIIIAVGYLVVYDRKTASAPVTTTVSNEANTAVRAQVESFGQVLKMISLLAPVDTVKADMDRVYGPFVAPTLLAQWENDPTTALGRTVSSPSPARIEIMSVTPEADGTYTVVGNVVETTSTEDSVAIYPVTLTLQNINNTWLITAASKGPYTVVK